MEAERDGWESQMRKKIEEERETHTQREKARLARMRDAEIEKSIHTLQTENVVFEKKAQIVLQGKIERLKLEFEQEKEDLIKVSNIVGGGH